MAKHLLFGSFSILVLCAAAGCVTTPAGYALNPGAYQENYIELVPSDAPYLVHPTGEYPAKPPPNRLWAGYEPKEQDTDNMDLKTLQLREQGYVMIGYAALNTRESTKKECDENVMTAQEYGNCRFWVAFVGRNPDANPLGEPLDAAVALNAELVVTQRDYSFSRVETQAQRIVTADGVDTQRGSGSSSASSRNDYRGSSNTQGYSDTSGTHSSETIGGSVGYGMFGPTAEVNASATQGRHQESTRYGSSTNDRSVSLGSNSDSYRNRSSARTQHWGTALIENTVDHYEYVATFWKRVKPEQMVLGALTDPLPREFWPVIGSRSARVVRSVIGETPAFYAEVWEGDIIVAMNGEKVQGEKDLHRRLDLLAGQQATITIYRDGAFYDLDVSLNQGSAGYASR